MKTAHLNVIKGLNVKYLFIKFDSKILQALQIPVWEAFVSKNLPDNCIKTCSLSKNSRALRTTGWFLIRKGLLDLRTHWMIFELRCYKKQWNTSITFLFIPVEISWRSKKYDDKNSGIYPWHIHRVLSVEPSPIWYRCGLQCSIYAVSYDFYYRNANRLLVSWLFQNRIINFAVFINLLSYKYV